MACVLNNTSWGALAIMVALELCLPWDLSHDKNAISRMQLPFHGPIPSRSKESLTDSILLLSRNLSRNLSASEFRPQCQARGGLQTFPLWYRRNPTLRFGTRFTWRKCNGMSLFQVSPKSSFKGLTVALPTSKRNCVPTTRCFWSFWRLMDLETSVATQLWAKLAKTSFCGDWRGAWGMDFTAEEAILKAKDARAGAAEMSRQVVDGLSAAFGEDMDVPAGLGHDQWSEGSVVPRHVLGRDGHKSHFVFFPISSRTPQSPLGHWAIATQRSILATPCQRVLPRRVCWVCIPCFWSERPGLQGEWRVQNPSFSLAAKNALRTWPRGRVGPLAPANPMSASALQSRLACGGHLPGRLGYLLWRPWSGAWTIWVPVLLGARCELRE